MTTHKCPHCGSGDTKSVGYLYAFGVARMFGGKFCLDCKRLFFPPSAFPDMPVRSERKKITMADAERGGMK